MTSVLDLDCDIRTLDDWGRALGMSRATIKCRCTNVGVSAKDTLDLARLLRVVSQHQTDHWYPRDLLDIVDPRTLQRLLQRAGIDPSSRRAPGLSDFLKTQRLVTSRTLLAALTTHLLSRPILQLFLRPQ